MAQSELPRRFEGKVAVVTGAAQGIGYEVAKRLGQEGACIVVADVAAGPAGEAVESLAAIGVSAEVSIGDLSLLAGAEAAMERAAAAFGGLDILVNNVGGAIRMKPFWQFSESEMREEIDRSLWPSLFSCRAAVPYLRRRGGGCIVNVGSNAATDGFYRIPYSTCKGGIISLTRSLAPELAGMNIRVNCVSPGRTLAPDRKTARDFSKLSEQEMEWMGQFAKLVTNEELIVQPATAEQQAAVIAFVASDEAGHITGEVIETGRRGLRMADVLGVVP